MQKNIETSQNHGVLGDFHNSHNQTEEWGSQVKNVNNKVPESQLKKLKL